MAFARGRPAARPAVAEATAEAAVMAADIGLETPVCLKAPRGTKSGDSLRSEVRYFVKRDLSFSERTKRADEKPRLLLASAVVARARGPGATKRE